MEIKVKTMVLVESQYNEEDLIYDGGLVLMPGDEVGLGKTETKRHAGKKVLVRGFNLGGKNFYVLERDLDPIREATV